MRERRAAKSRGARNEGSNGRGYFRVSRASLEGLRKKRRLLVVYGVSGSVKYLPK